MYMLHLSLPDSWGVSGVMALMGGHHASCPSVVRTGPGAGGRALGSHNVLDMRVRTADFHAVEDTWLALSMLPGLWPPTPLPRRTRHLPYVVSCLTKLPKSL